jgi:hypothetical protein
VHNTDCILVQFQLLCPRIQGSQPDSVRERLRLQTIEEVLASEKDYVLDLGWIIELWLNPIREQMLLTPLEIQQIFSNLEVILGVNQALLRAMKKKIREVDYTRVELGEVFLQLVCRTSSSELVIGSLADRIVWRRR